MQKRSLSADARDKLDEELDGPFEALRSALGVPPLSSRFLADTPGVRDELVDFRLFRSWFDAYRTWKPVSRGDQFSQSDVVTRARAARSALAQWPPLLAKLDRYEEELERGD